MSGFETLRQATRGYALRSAVIVLLTLPSMISTGCSTKTPMPPAICRDGNDEQRAAWDRVVKLAKTPGDPFRIEPGVLWAGAHLWRCRDHGVDGI